MILAQLSRLRSNAECIFRASRTSIRIKIRVPQENLGGAQAARRGYRRVMKPDPRTRFKAGRTSCAGDRARYRALPTLIGRSTVGEMWVALQIGAGLTSIFADADRDSLTTPADTRALRRSAGRAEWTDRRDRFR
jgi:hypothetical protein